METLIPIEIPGQQESPSPNAGVTALIRRQVESSESVAYLEALKLHAESFSRLHPRASMKVFRSTAASGQLEITIIQHFPTQTDHDEWVNSPEFQSWREEIAPPESGSVTKYVGMQALFTNGSDGPPRWKMAVLLIFAVYPMSLAISEWFAPALARIPTLLGTLITSVVIVWMMTYVITPLLTALFARWLNASK
ncbi:antibiotic biosynthesis monooxygenase (ABM) superfamily enzyme [Terrimicrobium sacchariphilum]|uniref:Antibiotic biosynthesis monooxygenase (ABM) superfamily enzyme n=1 Tax=Terrimicrobium sacchariphilum TaxID=690879 RepID=A0A146G655_TERSA|nr:hypothetical protein [Terrimicrobium sacchariphilum]GAT33070.1 antibiotic biosynthesis monooxygenase (ABM) superfamily enzyme [Terrimicrobium sacchariphilum]